jgi:outer membrane protein TolC
MKAHAFSWSVAVCGALVLTLGTRASAQNISEDRIKELIRQASDAAQQQSQAFTPPPTPSDSGTQVELTLDDAVKLALERNLDIAVQRMNPELQDIAIASARSVYHPNLTSTFSKASQNQAPTSQLQLSQGGGGVVSDTLTYNGGFAQQLPWFGGSVSATLNNSRLGTNSNNAFYNPQFNSLWTANYTQPIFKGLRIDSARQQIHVTRINRDISDVQLRATITNTVSNVRNAYWDYVYATQAVEVARASLDLADKLVQDNQTRVEIGTMAPIDVVQAQAQQATARQALVTAENTKRTTELALKRLIVAGTSDPNWSATLNPTDRPEFRPEPVDLEAAIRRALSERTDVAIAKKNLESNDVTLKFLHDQTLPEVDLSVNYGLQGVGGPYLQRSNTGVLGSNVTTVVPGGIADAFNSLFNNKYPRWTVGLNVSYPLGLTSQEAAVARARVQLNQVQAQIKQVELQVATDVTNAVINVRNTAEAVQAAQAARELSQQRLDAEQSKFEVGMSTNYFVVQAQRDLADARNSELRAILNYRKALVELERLQQTTLQSANITVLSAGGGGSTAVSAGNTGGAGGSGGRQQ